MNSISEQNCACFGNKSEKCKWILSSTFMEGNAILKKIIKHTEHGAHEIVLSVKHKVLKYVSNPELHKKWTGTT